MEDATSKEFDMDTRLRLEMEHFVRERNADGVSRLLEDGYVLHEEDEIVNIAALSSSVAILKMLVEKFDYDLSKGKSVALRLAARYGNHECLEYVLPFSDPLENDSEAIRGASENGHANCVRLLLECSSLDMETHSPLVLAAKNGHQDCVAMLVGKSYLTTRSLGLAYSAKGGFFECVKLLLDEETGGAFDSIALQHACDAKNEKLIRLVLPFSNAESARKSMLRKGQDVSILDAIMQHDDLMSKSDIVDFQRREKTL